MSSRCLWDLNNKVKDKRTTTSDKWTQSQHNNLPNLKQQNQPVKRNRIYRMKILVQKFKFKMISDKAIWKPNNHDNCNKNVCKIKNTKSKTLHQPHIDRQSMLHKIQVKNPLKYNDSHLNNNAHRNYYEIRWQPF